MNVEGDGRHFANGNGQVCGRTAVVPSCVSVHRVDGQEATRGHSLPVRKHLLEVEGQGSGLSI